jgi:hypothetical protein
MGAPARAHHHRGQPLGQQRRGSGHPPRHRCRRTRRHAAGAVRTGRSSAARRSASGHRAGDAPSWRIRPPSPATCPRCWPRFRRSPRSCATATCARPTAVWWPMSSPGWYRAPHSRLPGACTALDDEGRYRHARGHPGRRPPAASAPGSAEFEQAWSAGAGPSRRAHGCHALVGGLATRLLFDAQQADLETTARRLSLALSTANDPAPAAAWLEGFLNQSALVLLHDPSLWALVDDWVAGLSEEHFVRVLPLVRRAFSAFAPAERRQLGERARRPAAPHPPPRRTRPSIRRAPSCPIPLLQRLLGIAP